MPSTVELTTILIIRSTVTKTLPHSAHLTVVMMALMILWDKTGLTKYNTIGLPALSSTLMAVIVYNILKYYMCPGFYWTCTCNYDSPSFLFKMPTSWYRYYRPLNTRADPWHLAELFLLRAGQSRMENLCWWRMWLRGSFLGVFGQQRWREVHESVLLSQGKGYLYNRMSCYQNRHFISLCILF